MTEKRDRLIFDLTAEHRETLEEIRKHRGHRSHAETLRVLIEEAWAHEEMVLEAAAKVSATTRLAKARKAAPAPQEAPRERFTIDKVRGKFVPRLKPDKTTHKGKPK